MAAHGGPPAGLPMTGLLIVLAGSDWRPAGYGLLTAAVSVGLAAFAACLLRFAYESQHSWFLSYGHGTAIVTPRAPWGPADVVPGSAVLLR